MIDLTCPITEVASLLPHSGAMVLLDRIIDFGEDFLIAETEICPDNILLRQGKLTTLAGIEIMAQGIAAWSGCMAARVGEPIRLGYLLGSRKLHIYQQELAIGSLLRTQIKMSIQDSTGFGVFDCQLIDLKENKLLIEGALNVFSPKSEQKETE